MNDPGQSGPFRTFFALFYELADNDKGYANFGSAQASFFLKNKETFINETRYHAACRPSHCQYLEKTKVNIYFIIGRQIKCT